MVFFLVVHLHKNIKYVKENNKSNIMMISLSSIKQNVYEY